MKVFYQRLRQKGKAAKVALIAVVRKLIILLNHVVRRQTPWENRTGELQAIAYGYWRLPNLYPSEDDYRLWAETSRRLRL